jgi:tetratricopeptide (TPR) repeat protein
MRVESARGRSLPQRDLPIMPGASVSHYRVFERLGEGGMGVVYAAEDQILGRRVALKFCSAAQDPQTRRALLDEAKKASSLNHPNIAQIYEFGETEQGEPFIAMELVPGRSVAEKLREGALAVAEAVQVVTAIAKALEASHRLGIVHRDIKPSNVRITGRGEVKVLDFGIASAVEHGAPDDAATVTLEGVVKGTPLYMAPEQVRGAAPDPRADLFSLGSVLYECLTGRAPFSGATRLDVVANVMGLDPPAPSSLNARVAPGLDRITGKLLAKYPGERYQSAGEVLAALEVFGARARPVPRTWREAWRRMAAVSGAVLLAGLAAIMVLRSLRPAHTTPPEAVGWYRSGLAALADGTHHKAAKALQRATAIDPSFTMAHARLAEAWDELEYTGRAQQEMLIAMHPGTSEGLSKSNSIELEAIHATVTGDFNRATALYRQLVAAANGPARLWPLLDLGKVLERAQKVPEAVAVYQEATRAESQSAAAFLRLGSLFVRQRDRAKAETALGAAETLYKASSNTEGVTECLYQRARLETDPNRSLALLDQASIGAAVSQNDEQSIKILLLASNRYQRKGDMHRAANEAQDAMNQAERSGLENLTTRGLIDLGAALFTNGGRPYLEKALDIARRNGVKYIEARALMNLGSLLIYTGETKQGVADVEEALAFYRSGGYRAESVLALVSIARTRESSGDYEGTLRDLQSAAQSAAQPSYEMGIVQEEKARVLGAQDRLPEALAQFRTAMQTYAEVGHKRGLAESAGAAAETAGWLGRETEAARLIQEGNDAIAGLDLHAARADLEVARATVALATGRYQQAAKGIERTLASRELDDPSAKCDLAIRLAVALTRSGRVQDGYGQSGRAVEAAAKLGDPALIAAAALAMGEAALTAGHRHDAVSALQRIAPALEATGRRESAWRAWAWLALAESGAPDGAAGRRARENYDKLMAAWSPPDVAAYAARPDIHKLLKAIFSSRKE